MKRPVHPSDTPPWWLLPPAKPKALLVPKRQKGELGSIGEYIFRDADGDGVPKVGTGIQGVTVELMQDGEVIASQVTGADGGYKFDNLPAGEYVVKVSNVPDDLVHVCGLDNPQAGTVTVNLGAGEKNDDVDIGFDIQADHPATASFAARSRSPISTEVQSLRNASNQQLLLELARRMR